MAGKVSVIFPVGPGVAGAGGALHDLLGQTYGDLEVLAVLNGCLPGQRVWLAFVTITESKD